MARRRKEAQDRLAPKQGRLSFEDDLREMKPKLPAGEELADTVVGKRVFEGVAEPERGDWLHFAQGKAIEKRVGLAAGALARFGQLSAAEDGEKVSRRCGAQALQVSRANDVLRQGKDP